MSISTSSKSELRDRFQDRILFDEPLHPYLAYAVGGPADILIFPRDTDELQFLGDFSKKNAIPITVVGNGTNLLVQDGGIRGITVSLTKAFKEIEVVEETPTGCVVRSGGGVSKPELLEWAIERGFSGLEFSAGVPGTIGGGIYMNAGTKYGCYGDILKKLCLFDFQSGIRILGREDAHFGYREQSAVKGSLVAWSDFSLTRGDKRKMRQEVDRIIQERTEKQPLDYPSCGSTFKNPPEGLSAGRLIERAGLKGRRVGAAEISLKHANFILNKGNAKARDILELIQIVKAEVQKQFGVLLECEVVILGEPAH